MLFESLPPKRNTTTIARYPLAACASALFTPQVHRLAAAAPAVTAAVEVRNLRRDVFMISAAPGSRKTMPSDTRPSARGWPALPGSGCCAQRDGVHRGHDGRLERSRELAAGEHAVDFRDHRRGRRRERLELVEEQARAAAADDRRVGREAAGTPSGTRGSRGPRRCSVVWIANSGARTEVPGTVASGGK